MERRMTNLNGLCKMIPPDEFSDDDETEEDEDEPREVERNITRSAEFDEVDYSCDEDLEDLAYTGTMAVGVEELISSGTSLIIYYSSEKTILSSMSFC
jgi:hypothetical protein